MSLGLAVAAPLYLGTGPRTQGADGALTFLLLTELVIQIECLVLHSFVQMSLGLAVADPLYLGTGLRTQGADGALTFLLLTELVIQIECLVLHSLCECL